MDDLHRNGEIEFRPFHSLEEETCPPTHNFFRCPNGQNSVKSPCPTERATFRPNTASCIEASRKITSMASNFMPKWSEWTKEADENAPTEFWLAGYSRFLKLLQKIFLHQADRPPSSNTFYLEKSCVQISIRIAPRTLRA